jgi:hypothetical protein
VRYLEAVAKAYVDLVQDLNLPARGILHNLLEYPINLLLSAHILFVESHAM